MSNVNLSSALTDMLQAQRMFDVNTEALQLTNHMENDAVTIRP